MRTAIIHPSNTNLSSPHLAASSACTLLLSLLGFLPHPSAITDALLSLPPSFLPAGVLLTLLAVDDLLSTSTDLVLTVMCLYPEPHTTLSYTPELEDERPELDGMVYALSKLQLALRFQLEAGFTTLALCGRLESTATPLTSSTLPFGTPLSSTAAHLVSTWMALDVRKDVALPPSLSSSDLQACMAFWDAMSSLVGSLAEASLITGDGFGQWEEQSALLHRYAGVHLS